MLATDVVSVPCAEVPDGGGWTGGDVDDRLRNRDGISRERRDGCDADIAARGFLCGQDARKELEWKKSGNHGKKMRVRHGSAFFSSAPATGGSLANGIPRHSPPNHIDR